jgi:hypothetical protein
VNRSEERICWGILTFRTDDYEDVVIEEQGTTNSRKLIDVNVWLSTRHLNAWIDVLRYEEPLWFVAEDMTDGPPRAMLMTGQEPPGEGELSRFFSLRTGNKP